MKLTIVAGHHDPAQVKTIGYLDVDDLPRANQMARLSEDNRWKLTKMLQGHWPHGWASFPFEIHGDGFILSGCGVSDEGVDPSYTKDSSESKRVSMGAKRGRRIGE